MAFAVKMKLVGLSQALASIRGLPKAVQKTVLRKALDKASQPITKAVKRLTPRGTKWASPTGTLRRAIGRKTRVYRRSGVVVVVIGPRRGGQYWREVKVKPDKVFREIRGKTVRIRNPNSGALLAPRYGVKYAHLLEFGTAKRAARPFIRPAFHQSKGAAVLIARREIAAGIKAYAMRMRGKRVAAAGTP